MGSDQRDLNGEIEQWLQEVMLSDSANWTKLKGLMLWLQQQSTDDRIEFHRRRIKVTMQYQGISDQLLNMGNDVKLLEIARRASIEKQIAQAELLLIEDPAFYKLCKVWSGFVRARVKSLSDKYQPDVEKRLEGTGVSLQCLLSVLNRGK